ncbi:acetyl-CoA carboxylase biotin carboxyl carrier protein [Paraliobacillus zengyii]|uniref:acetyl-CoA carboxylase biotin carboxyl carrier protein n=1 Tax=Paraliobacillus zengyii TaxID=2213194 RepID=UPI000DD475D2|nr:acetyl-CoA carboxylase biotin carboxyl carrier protein [Paraliobacillus zengyii]
MLKIEDIRALIKEIDGSSIDEFSYEVDGSKLSLKKNTEQEVIVENKTPISHASASPHTNTESNTTGAIPIHYEEPVEEQGTDDYEITSPMVGTFYHSSSPDAEAFVSVGDKVTEDTVVCIIEAMKLFNEIEADVDGEIAEILVKNGELVEYGQPLFRVKQN